MGTKRTIRYSLLALLTIVCCNVYGQKSPAATPPPSAPRPVQAPPHPAPAADGPALVWKKQIARVIDMGAKNDIGSERISDVSSENSLMDMFVNLIRGNKVIAYTNSDHNFTTKLTVAELNRILSGKKDTMLVIDPVTGKTTTKIIQKDVNLDAIHKFKILEEWSCYPATGKTEIQIIGLAPLKDVVADDGTVHGVQPLFWLRFNDISAILVRYQQYHPNNTLAGHVWDDYFSGDGKGR